MSSISPRTSRRSSSASSSPARRIHASRSRKVDKSRFDREAAIILSILNDAWGNNWGFVPITDSEVAFTGKKLKPIVFEDLIRIAELDGEPVAFMMTLPDLNEALKPLNGNALSVRLDQAALVAAQAQGQDDARAADGRRPEAAVEPHGQPARLS